MAELVWIANWQETVATLQPWLLPLLGAAIVVFTLFGALVRRHSRNRAGASAAPSSNSGAVDEPDLPGFLRQKTVCLPPAQPLSVRNRTGRDQLERDFESEPAGDDRAAGWRPLYPYLKHRRFTTWKAEDLTASVEEEACPLAIKLFISHRWQTPDDPDPHMKNVATLVEYLSRVFMMANGMLDENSQLAKELVAGDQLRQSFDKASLTKCICGSVGWLDVRALMPAGDIFLSRVDQTSRRDFYRLLKHVRIWYDYASLPQARTTPEERSAFDRAFSRLSSVVARSDVLALWGVESINRAWCVFEVLAGRRVHFCAPSQAKHDPALKMMFEAHGYRDLDDYQGRPSMNIMIHVNAFRASIADKDAHEIERYLRERNIDCTVDEDFGRVATLIHQNLSRQRAL